jgi:hypothetical protein
MLIIGFPGVKMTKEQMMLSALDITQGNEITWVKLQMRMKVEGFDMMDFQSPAFTTTGHTSRLTQEMLLSHSPPLRTPFVPMASSYVCSMVPFLYSPFLRMVCCFPCTTLGRSDKGSHESKSSDEQKQHQ